MLLSGARINRTKGQEINNRRQRKPVASTKDIRNAVFFNLRLPTGICWFVKKRSLCQSLHSFLNKLIPLPVFPAPDLTIRIMPLFQSKHQKLILQCYPAGRGSDKKPNSSELSYLLYYVSTRRVKLEKVGKFLVKKNQTDVSRNRTGNIQVTLDILNALIKKCPDDLNVYADSVNAVLLSVLPTLDLSLCQHAIVVFHTFCQALENDFTSDIEFTNNFNRVTEMFINFGSTTPKSNTNEWIALGLQACQSIASGKNLIQTQGSTVIDKIIPLILNHLHFDRMQERSLRKLNSLATESVHETSDRLNSRIEGSTPVEIDLHELALAALKSFYYTDNSSQISLVTRNLADYCAKTNVNEKNINVLINAIASWIPVQLRFLILTILMGKLDKNGPEQKQLIYLVAITSLLSSAVNLVGLSVVDNLRQLLTLQSYLILKSASSGESRRLIQGYSNAIGALTTHIYYQDQVLDIVNELLVTVKDIMNPNNSNYRNPNKFHLIVTLLGSTKNIIVNSNSGKALQTSRIPLEIFAETFDLLAFCDSTRQSDSTQVQFKYIDLLITELKLEYSKLPDFRSADHDGLISDSHNSVVNLFYEQVEKLAKLPIAFLSSNLPPLLQLLQIFIQTFGSNSTVNFIPFFLHWQLQDLSNTSPSSLLLDNFAYFIAYYNAIAIQSTELAKQILSRIQFRKEDKLWVLPLNAPPEEMAPSESFNFSKEDLKQSTRLIQVVNEYHETIFQTHYKYPRAADNSMNGVVVETYHTADITSEFDHSYREDETTDSNVAIEEQQLQEEGQLNNSQHTSLAVLIQNSENHSIQSLPVSARGLLNNKLNVPKVKELRRVISGYPLRQPAAAATAASSPVVADDPAISTQRTDVTTLLSELELNDDLGGRGNLTFN